MMTLKPWILCLVLASGCGTIAGNPKKPPGVDESPQENIAIEIPTIDLEWDFDTFASEDASLHLVAPTATGQKALFNAQGKRFQKQLKELNRTAKMLSELIQNHGEKNPDGSILFRKKGAQGQLSAKITEGPKEGWDHEAVLCAGSQPTQLIRWTKDGRRMDIWRDFSKTQGEGEEILSVSSHVRVETSNAGELTVDLAASGEWNDADENNADGRGILERFVATRGGSSPVTSFKSVQDRFDGGLPSSPTGDIYLVGRLYPSDKGKKALDSEFVGYSRNRPRLGCTDPFSETSETLWTPAQGQGGFCLGRRRDGKPFPDFEAFANLVVSLKPIGILKAETLGRVNFPSVDFSCDQD